MITVCSLPAHRMSTGYPKAELLTREEEVSLSAKVKSGDRDALERYVLANQGLVKKIVGDFSWCGLDPEDLVQEGNLGLIRAVELYDPERAKFSTYAALWIKQRIFRCIYNTKSTIRIPVHLLQRMARFEKAEFGGLEDQDQFSESELRRMAAAKEASASSIDAPIRGDAGGGIDGGWLENIPDQSAVDPSEASDTGFLEEELERLLKTLKTERERDIIRRRFGLGGYEAMTLEEIGELYCLTCERIRQIEAKALKKMRIHLKRRESPCP